MSTSNLSNPSEIWKPVPGYEGFYSVSNHGRVRREKTNSNTRKGRLLKLNTSSRYPRVSLWKHGEQETAYVHRLVAAAFLGPEPDGHEVNHIDGNPENNHVSNLEYVTTQGNAQHAHENGLTSPAKGQTNAQTKLTEAAVREIRRNALAPRSVIRKLAKKHGISERHTFHIMRGERWEHLPYREDEKIRPRKR